MSNNELGNSIKAMRETIEALKTDMQLIKLHVTTLDRLEELESELIRLRSDLVTTEARWRVKSGDLYFGQIYRDTIAGCADELAALLADANDIESQAENEEVEDE